MRKMSNRIKVKEKRLNLKMMKYLLMNNLIKLIS